MKLFDSQSFMDIVVTQIQAKDVAQRADDIFKVNSFVLYGRYEDRQYLNFTSHQKAGDTHKLLGTAPKAMSMVPVSHNGR